jgi:predicted nucleotidyltransferase component of viral defense system
MSVKIIQEQLKSYNCQTDLEEQHAIREITQEVVLAALGRGDFFKHALFQGGTCLRIFHGLNRFSEDMDFILRKNNPNFQLRLYLEQLIEELSAFGYQLEVTDRSKLETTVKKAFLKDSSIGKLLEFSHRKQTGLIAKIRIKIEVDTNPPAGSNTELRYLDFPFVSAVTTQDLPSLFAGKVHALLCRKYIKGRDWYDFIWYTARGTKLNYNFLKSALHQEGPWKQQHPQIDKNWVCNTLKNKIKSMDWKQAAEDVRRFIPNNEQPSLALWSQELFLHQQKKWEQTSP